MAVRTLALVGCALLACVLVGGGYPQVPVEPIPVPPAFPTPPHATAPVVGAIPQPSLPSPPKTVDQLIGDLTELRRQKAELEKKEQAVTAELRLKLKEQRDRLSKLGIEPVPAQQAVPAIPEGTSAVGSIAVPVIPAPSGNQ